MDTQAGTHVMQRIGYFFEYPTVSGAEGSALELLAAMDRTCFTPIVFAPPGGPLASRLEALDIPPRPWRPPRRPHEQEDLAQRLLSERLDILHGNTLHLGRLTGRLGPRMGIPAVAHIREFGTLSQRMRENLAANHALIAVSTAVRDDLVRQGLPSTRLHVIHNGVSPPPPPLDIRATLRLPPHTPLVVWAGQITVRKGPELFLSAAAKIAREMADVNFLVLGDAFGVKDENLALRERMHAAASREPLHGRLHLLGWREDARAVMGAATVLMHTAHQEPLGRVLMEALAAGIPLVATAVGGTPELVGSCGELVPPDDADALARASQKVMEDESHRARLAREGRARWRERFQPARMARAVEKVWRSVSPNSAQHDRGQIPSG